MTDSIEKIDWKARAIAVNAEMASWLIDNTAHLELIQWVITQEYDRYCDSDEPDAAESFMFCADDAIRSLIRVVCDLRQRDFLEQAKAKHPELFNAANTVEGSGQCQD